MIAPRTAQVLALVVAVGAGVAGCGDDDGESSTAGEPPTAAELTGLSFTSTDVAGETLVDGTQITVRFERDSLSANAGCNTMMGGYQLDGAALVVGELAQTLMGCDDERQRQDEWVAALMTGRPSLTLAGDVLTMTSGPTTVQLAGSVPPDASTPPTS